MKSNEHRIGNWITSDGDFFQVTSIKDDYIAAGALGIYPAGMDEEYGIPLTEEWLKRIDMSTHDVVWHNFASDAGGYFLWVGGHKVYIKYLHHFQNIAFALTGSELEIKPNTKQ